MVNRLDSGNDPPACCHSILLQPDKQFVFFSICYQTMSSCLWLCKTMCRTMGNNCIRYSKQSPSFYLRDKSAATPQVGGECLVDYAFGKSCFTLLYNCIYGKPRERSRNKYKTSITSHFSAPLKRKKKKKSRKLNSKY